MCIPHVLNGELLQKATGSLAPLLSVPVTQTLLGLLGEPGRSASLFCFGILTSFSVLVKIPKLNQVFPNLELQLPDYSISSPNT